MDSNSYRSHGFTHENAFEHMRGVNFTKEVRVQKLDDGERFQQLQVEGAWQGKYYSKLGEIATKLGINPQGRSYIDKTITAKVVKFYKAKVQNDALYSFAKL